MSFLFFIALPEYGDIYFCSLNARMYPDYGNNYKDFDFIENYLQFGSSS
jgi:hypothetical protein